MLNAISIQGRLTADPVLRYTQSNTPVASFTLAVERDYKERNGSRATDFIDCVAWRQTGEFASKYFHKGEMMIVSGRLQFRTWTDKNGNNRRNAEILVSNIYFGQGKSQAATAPEFEELDDDGDLPFYAKVVM